MATVYRGIGTTVARMAGNHPEMDRVAGVLLRLAKANAVPHIDTTTYIRKLHVINAPGKKGVRDRLVVAGDKAAMSIEYGHAQLVKNPGNNGYDFKWIPGQFILTKAIAQIPGSTSSSFGRIS